MCGWRDGYYWKAKERRESGEDKREFEELLKQDWLQFERRGSGRSRGEPSANGSQDTEIPEELLRDSALYAAKHDGRNCVRTTHNGLGRQEKANCQVS